MTRYRVVDEVLRADLEEQAVLLNPDTGTYHLLNATGRRLIAEMEAGTSLEDAIGSLVEETGGPHERIEHDARTFIEAMLDRCLLEAVEP